MTGGANFSSLFCGSSKYRATSKLNVVTSKKVVNNKVDKPASRRWQLYQLNKAKVKKKVLAFAALKQSQKFLAFYTMTFPEGLPDRYIYTIHNIALTRIRKHIKNFNYLWVSEYQKNGTLHFHMITNNFMNVKVVNHYYKKAIQNCLAANPHLPVEFNPKLYNGVDVRRIFNVKGASCYITKYVTKNNETFERLPWNCSSSISRLFTGAHVHQDYIELCKLNIGYYEKDGQTIPLQRSFHNIVHTFFKSSYKSGIIRVMEKVNQLIYDNMISQVNQVLHDFHRLLDGWSFDNSGALRAPVFAPENISCYVTPFYNQFAMDLRASDWFK